MSETKPLFQVTKPRKDLSQFSIAIHAFPKTGKSTFFAALEQAGKKPLFCATEDGHHELEVACHRVTNWETFKQFVQFIVANAEQVKAQYSYIVLDLVSDLDQWCANYVAESMKIKDIADAEWAKGFRNTKKEFSLVIGQLMTVLPCGFISHSKEKEINIEGDKIKMQAPNMSNGAIEFINGKCDLIGFIIPSSKTKANPVISFQPSQMAFAGSRVKALATGFEYHIDDPKKTIEAINNILKP